MRCHKARAAAAFTLLGCAGGTALADVEVTSLYRNGFENPGVGEEWSRRDKREQTASFTWFLGRFAHEDVTLTLGAVEPPPPKPGGGGGGGGGGDGDPETYAPGDPAPWGKPNEGDLRQNGNPGVMYRLSFDLYVIDSWDSAQHSNGPDNFAVVINGQTYFDETLSNHPSAQNFRPPDVGPATLGFASWKDSIYRGIEIWFEIDPSDELLEITFSGRTNQGLGDESWGIDNIRVGYVFTPTPGAGGLLAIGALLALRRNRADLDRAE